MRESVIFALVVFLVVGLVSASITASVIVLRTENSTTYKVELFVPGQPPKEWTARGTVVACDDGFGAAKAYRFTDAETGQGVKVVGGVVVITRLD